MTRKPEVARRSPQRAPAGPPPTIAMSFMRFFIMASSRQRENSGNKVRGEYSTKQYCGCQGACSPAQCISAKPLRHGKYGEKNSEQGNQNLSTAELIVRKPASEKDFETEQQEYPETQRSTPAALHRAKNDFLRAAENNRDRENGCEAKPARRVEPTIIELPIQPCADREKYGKTKHGAKYGVRNAWRPIFPEL